MRAAEEDPGPARCGGDETARGVRWGPAWALVGWEVYLDDDPGALVGVGAGVAAMSAADEDEDEDEDEDDGGREDEGEAAIAGGRDAKTLTTMTKTIDGDDLSEDERVFLSRLNVSLSIEDKIYCWCARAGIYCKGLISN